MKLTRLALAAITFALLLAAPSREAFQFGNSIAAVAAVDGTQIVEKVTGAEWGFTQDVLVTFHDQLDRRPDIIIDPNPTSAVKFIHPFEVHLSEVSRNATIELRWQKRANELYHVTIRNHADSTDIGSFVIRTPNAYPSPEAPVASKKNDDYYYGSLEHSAAFPFGLKLRNSGRIDPRALAALAAQKVHFVRFGPTPKEVAGNESGSTRSRTSYDFSSVDPTISSLHAAGIETLYVIDAAGAPHWANSNTNSDERPIFETPGLYAEYCGTIAKHLKQRFPTITRVEIGTNEPNYPSNWENSQAALDGHATYADQNGIGLALYLRACYNAVKSASPAMTVVAPGITLGGKSKPFLPFIDSLYKAGCRTGVCWDIFSLHSYTWSDPASPSDVDLMDNLYAAGDGPMAFYSYQDAQKRAVADGDAHTPPVMITETGFSSYERDARGVSPELQAYFASVAINQYLKDDTVKGIVWADIVNHTNPESLFGGIATYDQQLQPKPVFFTLRTFFTS